MANSQRLEFIVLAAGMGTRMKSSRPKVLHEVAGSPMVAHLCRQLLAFAAGLTRPVGSPAFCLNVVIGHGREQVQKCVQECVDEFLAASSAGTGKKVHLSLRFTVQEEQLGTGHAVKLALANSNKTLRSEVSEGGHVFVLNGDLPLLEANTLMELWQAHTHGHSVATLGSMALTDPAAYGRILRRGKTFHAVREFKDATSREREIKEVNGGVYVFQRDFIESQIPKIKNRNKAGEFYLPELFEVARRLKKNALAHLVANPDALLGVNDQFELSLAQKKLFRRVADDWMRKGVSFLAPDSSYIDSRSILGQRVVIYPGVILEGKCQIGDGAVLEANVFLRDVSVGEGAHIKQGSIAEASQIGRDCKVGPMAHLRPGSKLSERVKIGNFVEIKASSVGEDTSVAHLSYLGDAVIGKRVNIGCGFVTCNFDGTVKEGRRKHQSVIGDDVFIGSDCQVVAPIKLANGTYVASGSTVTQSVQEPQSLVVARTRQVTKPGYAKKYRAS